MGNPLQIGKNTFCSRSKSSAALCRGVTANDSLACVCVDAMLVAKEGTGSCMAIPVPALVRSAWHQHSWPPFSSYCITEIGFKVGTPDLRSAVWLVPPTGQPLLAQGHGGSWHRGAGLEVQDWSNRCLMLDARRPCCPKGTERGVAGVAVRKRDAIRSDSAPGGPLPTNLWGSEGQ